MVEVAGVEPASGNPQPSDPTCVATDWDSPPCRLRDRPSRALAPLESRPIPARRKNRASPLLVIPAERRHRDRNGCLVKQREPTQRWQFWFCQLFYEPTGTSARTRRSHDPRRSRSPPFNEEWVTPSLLYCNPVRRSKLTVPCAFLKFFFPKAVARPALSAARGGLIDWTIHAIRRGRCGRAVSEAVPSTGLLMDRLRAEDRRGPQPSRVRAGNRPRLIARHYRSRRPGFIARSTSRSATFRRNVSRLSPRCLPRARPNSTLIRPCLRYNCSGTSVTPRC